jgi:hypothetical protein
MKPFDLAAAKSGKPVCTRDGRDVRIICWDRAGNKPIIALIKTYEAEVGSVVEYERTYYESGSFLMDAKKEDDLFMKSETKTGWVNIYRNSLSREYRAIWDSEVRARNNIEKSGSYITTVPITWEE